MEEKNAVIRRSFIQVNDGDADALVAGLVLDFGEREQRLFIYNLYSIKQGLKAANYTGHFIYRILEVAGCNDWNKLEGKTIRVVVNDEQVVRIGHIVERIWFDPNEEFTEVQEDSAANAEKINSGKAARRKENG